MFKRMLRLWAASTNYSEIKALPYGELYNLRARLYEMGSTFIDILEYKRTMVIAAASFNNEKQCTENLKAYRSLLLPELGDADDEIKQMKNLMKELENTIVVIDKKSL